MHVRPGCRQTKVLYREIVRLALRCDGCWALRAKQQGIATPNTGKHCGTHASVDLPERHLREIPLANGHCSSDHQRVCPEKAGAVQDEHMRLPSVILLFVDMPVITKERSGAQLQQHEREKKNDTLIWDKFSTEQRILIHNDIHRCDRARKTQQRTRLASDMSAQQTLLHLSNYNNLDNLVG